MMKYSLVLFDYDGTLADSFPWVLSVMDQVAERYRLPKVSLDQREALRRMDARQIVRRMGLSAWKIPLIARDMRKQAARDTWKIPLFPGADRLLQGLSEQGTRLGIVSSNSADNVRRVLGPALAARIQEYECNVSLFGKAGRIRKIIRRIGIAPRETLLIGDELRDLEAAQKADVAFGAVAWGYTDIQAFLDRSPQEVFMSMDDLLAKFDLH